MKLSTDGTWLGTTSWEGGAAIWDMSLWIAAPNKDNEKVKSSKNSRCFTFACYSDFPNSCFAARGRDLEGILRCTYFRQPDPSLKCAGRDLSVGASETPNPKPQTLNPKP